MAHQRVSPVVVLALVSALPAIALGGVWRFTNDRADAATLAIEEPEDADPLGALPATPLLSMRRTPDLIAHDVNVADLLDDLQPSAAGLPPGSCLMVAVDAETIVDANGSIPVVPASNVKLATAAVALELLGPEHRYTTEVRAEIGEGGVVDGDLYLVGGGDPLLAAQWYEGAGLAPYPQRPATRLEDLVDALVAAGVTQVRGRVIGDGTRYDDEAFAPTWGNDVRLVEVAPIGGLLANDGWVAGARARGLDPAEAAAAELTRMLEDSGIDVRGRAMSGTSPGEMVIVASVESAPLGEVVAEMLRDSDNTTAEMVLKEIGIAATGNGSRDAGLTAVRATLTGWGLPTEGLALVDGSGLSVENRMSCALLVALLARSDADAPLGAALAVLGRSGTLGDVGVTHRLAGRLQGKTGTLTDAKALAGYVPTSDGSTIEFALVLNGQVEGVSVSDPNVFGAAWTTLFDVLAEYPSGPSAQDLGPAVFAATAR